MLDVTYEHTNMYIPTYRHIAHVHIHHINTVMMMMKKKMMMLYNDNKPDKEQVALCQWKK